ncbi:MAG: CbiQ family ECF transporter T component [Pseudomonadota bacterium]|nr:CbiQ family ECF transporter T component [Pseudomonadota bacterium]
MHPASRILIYLLAALAIPGLPFFWLPLLLIFALAVDSLRQPWRLSSRSPGRPKIDLAPSVAVAASAALRIRPAPRGYSGGGVGVFSAPGVQLLWRTRWLLLVLFLGYAYSLPGEPAWSWLGAFSPTQEGLARGGQQALRLLVLLLWLDLLVLRLPTASLMAGVYTLLRPFTRLGLNVERAALRLGLTLRAIEGLERGRGNLRRLFGEELGADLPTTIHLEIQAMQLRDMALPALIGILLLWLSA